MPIQGSLDEVSLADVLQLLSLGKKTGRLSLNDRETQGHIYLNAGRVCYATVVNRRDRLVDILVKTGKIRQRQLDEAIEQQARDGRKSLDQILVGSGSVDRKELERFVSAQVEEAVFYMFTWKRGSFTYQSRIRPKQQDFLVSLDPQALLLEAARRVDEWSLLKQKIPTLNMVFQVDSARLDTARVTLTEEQKRILPLLDGVRDVNAVVEATGLVEFDVAKALYGLITAGFAQLVERRSTVRHLDYREFLAYLVREAEFADPERRRKAVRHILDCSVCTERLQRIHRRTGEMTQLDADAVAASADVDSTPSVAESPPAAPLPSATRAKGDAGKETTGPPREERRRATSDRRRGERRGGDRRVATRPGLSLAWPVEQRSGTDRRRRDRRTSERRGRRAGGARGAARADTAAPEPGPVAAPESLAAAAQGPVAAAGAAPQPPVHRAAAGAPPPQPASTGSPRQEAQTPEPSRASSGTMLQAPGAEVVTNPPPAPHRHRRSSEIEWLVSPDDAIELLRHKPAAATRSSPRRATPQAATRAADRTQRERRSETRVSVVARPKRPRGQATTDVVPTATSAAPRSNPLATAQGAGMAAGSAMIGSPRVAPTSRPTRRWWLVVAATFVTAAGLGWVAGTQLGRGSTGGTQATVPAENGTRAPASGARLPVPVTARGTPAPAQPRAATAADSGRERGGEPRVGRTPPSAAGPARARESRPAPTTRSSADQPAGAPPAAPRESPARTVAAVPSLRSPATGPDTRPEPAPTIAGLSGVVRDARNGMPVGGARVSIGGTTLAIRTTESGVYEIRDVPEGRLTVDVAADGYLPSSVAVDAATPGSARELDVALRRTPTALQPDTGLAAGGWIAAGRAEATEALDQPVAVIAGLWIESITMTAESSRPRVRIAQLTASGDRIVLIETRAGGFARPGPARVTALRIMPPSEAYPVTTGTVSFGNLLVTAQTGLAPDSVRVLLGRLTELSNGR